MPVSGELITVAIAALGGVVWLVRLEGRVNALATLSETQAGLAAAAFVAGRLLMKRALG